MILKTYTVFCSGMFDYIQVIMSVCVTHTQTQINSYTFTPTLSLNSVLLNFYKTHIIAVVNNYGNCNFWSK